MSEPLKCQICEKAATVHLTQILNNNIYKVHLCESCAQSKGVTDPEGFSLEELFAKTGLGVFQKEPATPEAPTCGACGLSPAMFKETGRLGCPECYRDLNAFVVGMLRNLHRGVEHRGKVPERSVERMNRANRLSELERDLDSAVLDERYEDAATYRDEIRQIKEAFSEIR
jgi:protein arginine kinase activator